MFFCYSVFKKIKNHVLLSYCQKKTSKASKNLSLVSRFCAAKARPLCLEKICSYVFLSKKNKTIQ